MNPSSASALLLRYRFDSGREVAQPAEALLGSWHRTLFYMPGRDADLEQAQPLLGLRGRIGEEARLRGLNERLDFGHEGDTVDQDGLLVLPQRPLWIRISDEQAQVVTSFPVPDSGLRIVPGPRIPSGAGGHYEQLQLTDASGTLLACCYESGWHSAQLDDSAGRGFFLWVADDDWFALADGDFHLNASGPRQRPSPLAARLA